MPSARKPNNGALRDYLVMGLIAVALVGMLVYTTTPGPHPMQGQSAPDAVLSDFDGTEFRLSEALGGEVVVLNFWASWCPPCQAELPHLGELAQAHAGKPVRFLAVSLDQDKESGAAMAASLNPALHAYWDSGAAAHAYSITGMPTTLVIGRDGVVAATFQGYSPGMMADIGRVVDTLLTEPVAAS